MRRKMRALAYTRAHTLYRTGYVTYTVLSYFVFPASRRCTKIVITGSLIRVARGLEYWKSRRIVPIYDTVHAWFLLSFSCWVCCAQFQAWTHATEADVFPIASVSVIRARRSENYSKPILSGTRAFGGCTQELGEWATAARSRYNRFVFLPCEFKISYPR